MSFNPDLAVPEPEEEDALDDMFASLDRKVKSMRTQLFADVVKEIAKSAKEERKKLLETAAKDFAQCMKDCVQPELDKLAAAVTDNLAKKQDAMAERLASLESRSKDRHTSLVSRLENLRSSDEQPKSEPAPQAPAESPILAQLQAKLDAMHAEMAARPAEPVKAPEAPKPKQWRFTVKRDLHNRITDIMACEEMNDNG